MNVGLPGTGIGGMFYLLSALCMPLVGALRREGAPTRWRVVRRQFLMALGIAAGMWIAGFLLAAMMGGIPLLAAAMRGGGADGRMALNVLQTATLVVSLSTLGLIICGVWIASFVVRQSPQAAALAPGAPSHDVRGSGAVSMPVARSSERVRRAKHHAA